MLSAKTLTEGSKGAGNVVAYMKATEYYRGGSEAFLGPARWKGLGATLLELDEGPKADQHFEKLLAGMHPHNRGEKLTRNAQAAGRRMGIDLTFSADKSVSLLLAMAKPEERQLILDAHRQAVDAAMGYLTQEAYSRTGAQGTGKREPLDAPVMRQVDHFDSREGDPNLHTHCVLLNLNWCEDGQWRSIEMEPLIQAKHSAGALYRAHLAEGLRGLGYAIESTREQDADERETGQVWHRVAGIGAALRNEFSKRRKAIEKAMLEEGLSSQEATLRTRQGKKDLTASEVALAAHLTIQEWHQAGRLEWHTADALKQHAKGQSLTPKDTADLLATLHKTDSYWNRYNLVDVLAKEGFTDAPERAKRMLSEGLKSGTLLELKADAQGRPRYCTKAQWDLEKTILDQVAKRSKETRFQLDPAMVERCIKLHEAKQGFTLSAEQREMVRFATQNPGAMACLVGRAGTGKTASAGCYIRAYQEAGFTILGTSTAQRAAEKLASETGLTECHSVAKLLQKIEKGELTLNDQTLLIVDEAGMVGASSLAKLQSLMDAAGGKMLLLGDPLQLQPVEAGSPFRLIIRDQGSSELTEIRRQKGDLERDIAMNFYQGKSGEDIVKEWRDTGMMNTAATKVDAVKAVVEAYLANPASHSEKLVLANTRADVQALTHALREELKAKGELTQATVIQVAGPLMGEKVEKEVCVGDRLAIAKNYTRLGLANGDRGIVQAIDVTKKGTFITLKLESDVEAKHGRIVRLNVDQVDRLDYAWANTNHAAQGQGKDHVFWLASAGPNLDRNMAMVAFTRTKKTFKSVCTEDHLQRIKEQIEDWGLKQAASELQKEQAQGPEVPPPSFFTETWSALSNGLSSALNSFETFLQEREALATFIRHETEKLFKKWRDTVTQDVVNEYGNEAQHFEEQRVAVSTEAVKLERLRDDTLDPLVNQVKAIEKQTFALSEKHRNMPDDLLHLIQKKQLTTQLNVATAQRDALYKLEKQKREELAPTMAKIGDLRRQEARFSDRVRALTDLSQVNMAVSMRLERKVEWEMDQRVPDWKRKKRPLSAVLQAAQQAREERLRMSEQDRIAKAQQADLEARDLRARRAARNMGLEGGPKPPGYVKSVRGWRPRDPDTMGDRVILQTAFVLPKVPWEDTLPGTPNYDRRRALLLARPKPRATVGQPVSIRIPSRQKTRVLRHELVR